MYRILAIGFLKKWNGKSADEIIKNASVEETCRGKGICECMK